MRGTGTGRRTSREAADRDHSAVTGEVAAQVHLTENRGGSSIIGPTRSSDSVVATIAFFTRDIIACMRHTSTLFVCATANK